MAFSSIEEILQDIRAGKMVILLDDDDRENEGDIVMGRVRYARSYCLYGALCLWPYLPAHVQTALRAARIAANG